MAAFTKLFDLVPGWIYALAVAGLLLACAVERGRAQHYKTQIAEFRLDAEKGRADAEHRQRQIEAQRERDITEIANNAQTQIIALAAERDAAVSAADSLRIAAASAARRARANPKPAGPGPGEPREDALDLFAQLLRRHGSELAEVSGYADSLRVAGVACEASYDSVRR